MPYTKVATCRVLLYRMGSDRMYSEYAVKDSPPCRSTPAARRARARAFRFIRSIACGMPRRNVVYNRAVLPCAASDCRRTLSRSSAKYRVNEAQVRHARTFKPESLVLVVPSFICSSCRLRFQRDYVSPEAAAAHSAEWRDLRREAAPALLIAAAASAAARSRRVASGSTIEAAVRVSDIDSRNSFAAASPVAVTVTAAVAPGVSAIAPRSFTATADAAFPSAAAWTTPRSSTATATPVFASAAAWAASRTYTATATPSFASAAVSTHSANAISFTAPIAGSPAPMATTISTSDAGAASAALSASAEMPAASCCLEHALARKVFFSGFLQWFPVPAQFTTPPQLFRRYEAKTFLNWIFFYEDDGFLSGEQSHYMIDSTDRVMIIGDRELLSSFWCSARTFRELGELLHCSKSAVLFPFADQQLVRSYTT